jgi:hypothetical protein
MKLTIVPKYACCFLLIFHVASCISIHGSFGGLTSEFYNSYKKNPSLYVFLDSTHEYNNIPPKILIATDKDIAAVIHKNSKVLLYSWKPNCPSEHCYPLLAVYAQCQSKHVLFCPISNYYDHEAMQQNLSTHFSIYAPNIQYYKTNRTTVYLNKFYKNLTINDYRQGQFFYFKDGQLTTVFDDITRIDSLQ